MASPIVRPRVPMTRGLPQHVRSCCDDCSCQGCPDCFNNGRGRLELGGFFNGGLGYKSLGDGEDLITGSILDPSSWGQGDSGSSWTSQIDPTRSDHTSSWSDGGGSVATAAGSTNKPPSGGSSAGSGVASFLSSLATGILRPNNTVMPVAKPWYSTPVGMGAIVLGVVAVYLLAKKD